MEKKLVSNYYSFKPLTKAAIYFCTNLYTNTRLTIQDNGRELTVLKHNSKLTSFAVSTLNKPLASKLVKLSAIWYIFVLNFTLIPD